MKDGLAPDIHEAQRRQVRRLGMACLAVGLWWSYPQGFGLGRLIVEQFALIVASPGAVWWSPYSRAFWALAPITLGGLLWASGSSRYAKSAAILMAALCVEGASDNILSAIFDSGWLKRKGGIITATFDRLLPTGLELASAIVLVIASFLVSLWAMRLNATWLQGGPKWRRRDGRESIGGRWAAWRSSARSSPRSAS